MMFNEKSAQIKLISQDLDGFRANHEYSWGQVSICFEQQSPKNLDIYYTNVIVLF